LSIHCRVCGASSKACISANWPSAYDSADLVPGETT
jgi:hypothetical protein